MTYNWHNFKNPKHMQEIFAVIVVHLFRVKALQFEKKNYLAWISFTMILRGGSRTAATKMEQS